MISSDKSIAKLNNNFIVPAYSVRLTLQGCQEHLTTNFYHQFLREAGLQRFADKPPPLDSKPVATFDEMATFMGKIYSVMGVNVYPLFCQNLGWGLAKIFTTLPVFIKMKAKAAQTLTDPVLTPKQKITLVINLINKYMPFSEDSIYKADGLSLVFETAQCLYCYHLKTDKSVCYARRAMLESSLRWVTGWSFKIEQTGSVARGDPACVLRFTPLSFN